MRKLSTLTQQEKIDALSNAIRGKCQYGITSQRLNSIIERLNLNRVYYIKTTRDHDKFLNYVTQEFIATANKQILSYTISLYGKFECGYFHKDQSTVMSVPGFMNGVYDAAAIKITLTRIQNALPTVTHTIVLYESGKFAV